jgi:hemerythrin superfamily protein
MELHMSLTSTIKKTGKKISDAVAGTATDMEEMDILDTLKQEHEEVSELLGQLVSSERAGERKALLGQIKAALVPHVRAEEKIVYDAVIALKDKQPKLDGHEGYLEHGLADRMLATLGKIDNAMSPEFSAAAKVLKEIVEHHVEEEERNVWSDVKKNFSSDERMDMNRRFELAKSKVRLPS